MSRRPRYSPETSPERDSGRPVRRYIIENEPEIVHSNTSDEEEEEVIIRRRSPRPGTKPKSRAYHTDYFLPVPPRDAQGHLVVYHVDCSLKGTHKAHEKTLAYLDHPRLYKGDSKMSALRGKSPIPHLSDYLYRIEDHIFVVNKRFNCNAYHSEALELFDPLPMPKDPEVPHSIQPYFFSLRHHGPLAIASSETMAILSDPLKEAIVEATGMTYKQVSNIDKSQNMNMLPHLLYHYRRYADEQASLLNPAQRHLLNDLVDYMKRSNDADYCEADELISQGLITQKHLVKLFGRNELLLSHEHGHPRAYTIDQPPKTGDDPLSLTAWAWEFNGLFYKENSHLLLHWPSSVPDDKPIPITSLSKYPLRHAPPETERRLRARGELFWKCRKGYYVSYDPPNTALEIQSGNPRYMIDVRTYHQMHTKAKLSPQDDLGDAINDPQIPDGPFALLLPPTILGFGFNDKKWRSLAVEHIKKINWNEEAFDRLVMQHHKKELIKALVTVHTASDKSTDIIEGKGNALIMLLHGGPGTGKTLTAESVAELTLKPLYRVTCGDIGTNPDEVEKYLESVLLIGTIWGCVVLLDEADVFLEERRETDLQRNALVSVFLRVLEYYDGILILTSNRIGTFDSAFKSRFQLAVHYPALDVAGRYEIWLNFINGLGTSKAIPSGGKLKSTHVNVDGLKEKIDQLAAVELNGRQIRNTVRTALQLAHFREETLDYRHFDRVIKVVDEFERHIDATRGFSDSDWAQHQGVRP
ncbi:hypothetical protein FE257_011384 [Aspergillus nanangensis]|uniref:AAA+ ATPase domain-containing protein n=1 Tax=Aspergillus nanangensis TaxID=2582783 RepID=A0AAD4CHL5_ASPNN|nr:hypothetical protein FE257_011384 [Aspergillus nanangensis]